MKAWKEVESVTTEYAAQGVHALVEPVDVV
jgi:hypothetical protein